MKSEIGYYIEMVEWFFQDTYHLQKGGKCIDNQTGPQNNGNQGSCQVWIGMKVIRCVRPSHGYCRPWYR